MGVQATTGNRIDEIVRTRQAAGRAPGVIAAVVRDGSLAHVATAGDLPARPADVQSRIGSISKTFTAALVLGLRDEGRIDLDEPVAAHLPGLAIGTVTPRRLLAHISGLRREPAGPWWERNPGVEIPSLFADIGPDALVHVPGRTYHYSNLGFGILGALVAAVTGETWEQTLTSRIIKPLGLDRTTYAPADDYLRGYVVHPYSAEIREEPREDAGAMAPAGQLWSTVTDLGKWATFLADPGAAGANAPLAPATVDEMCSPVSISDTVSWSAGQGLGIELWRDGDRIYAGHTGSMPGYVAGLAVHRETNTAAVVFANAYTGFPVGAVVRELLTTVLDAEPEVSRPWTAAEPPADVVPLLGAWWWMGMTFSVAWDGELVMYAGERPDERAWRLRRTGADEWRCHSGMNDGETMTVRRDADGTPIELDIATFIFSREPWPDVVR